MVIIAGMISSRLPHQRIVPYSNHDNFDHHDNLDHQYHHYDHYNHDHCIIMIINCKHDLLLHRNIFPGNHHQDQEYIGHKTLFLFDGSCHVNDENSYGKIAKSMND